MLRLVPQWCLTAEDWAEVVASLCTLRDAFRNDDLAAADRCLVDLAELAPSRLSSLAEAEPDRAQPAPEMIVELVVEIQSSPVTVSIPGDPSSC